MSAETEALRRKYEAKKARLQQRLNHRLGLDQMPRLRKFVYAITGLTVLFIGICMIVLPGPAVVVIPLGLMILGSEFAWARRVIRRGSVFVGRRIRKRVPRRHRRQHERA